MKRLFYFIMAIALLVPSYADAKTSLEKAREKACKAKLKEYKKGNWQALGSKPMELVLIEHYDKLATLGNNGHEVEGISTRSKSINVGKQSAINNAVVTYAQEAGSTLQGRIVSDMNINGSKTTGEFDNFIAAYERLVEKEIKGEMEPSFSIMRTNNDGTFEIRVYYIVEEDAAQKARVRAMEEAMKNSQIAQEHASEISDYVKQGFDQ